MQAQAPLVKMVPPQAELIDGIARYYVNTPTYDGWGAGYSFGADPPTVRPEVFPRQVLRSAGKCTDLTWWSVSLSARSIFSANAVTGAAVQNALSQLRIWQGALKGYVQWADDMGQHVRYVDLGPQLELDVGPAYSVEVGLLLPNDPAVKIEPQQSQQAMADGSQNILQGMFEAALVRVHSPRGTRKALVSEFRTLADGSSAASRTYQIPPGAQRLRAQANTQTWELVSQANLVPVLPKPGSVSSDWLEVQTTLSSLLATVQPLQPQFNLQAFWEVSW